MWLLDYTFLILGLQYHIIIIYILALCDRIDQDIGGEQIKSNNKV